MQLLTTLVAMEEIPFEQAFERLEAILEKLNQEKVSLDDSLKLYEEADGLIKQCGTRLNAAEKRIETLIRERNGELSLNASGQPETQPLDS